MPEQTQEAVKWALTQTFSDSLGDTYPITVDTPQPLVDAVRRYLNDHNVAYNTFSYEDLKPFFN